MDESELFFNLIYVFFCMCVIYPPEVFQRLGLTIEQLFATLLGDETINFVRYHQRRTSLNLFVHSCLPVAYFIIHQLKFSPDSKEKNNSNVLSAGGDIDPDFPMPQGAVAFKLLAWQMAKRLSLIALLAIPVLIFNWQQQNWRRHPISQSLVHYSNEPDNYEPVATDICNEIRRPLNYRNKFNSISTVFATENWIIKTSLYNVHFAHQTNTSLIVAKTETYNISHDTNDTLQMLSIMVKPNRADVRDFQIRINALEFRNLEERIRRPITIPENIKFHRNIIDRFIDVFKQQVELNPVVRVERTTDKCFACMLSEPNIKIHKQCADVHIDGRPLSTEQCCSNCYCRPMWCVECLARWFSARQNENEREIWLQQKCTCPMCRARFCILDVSYIQMTES